MATDLLGLSRALPSELRVRIAMDDDLDAMVDFANRSATPSQWMAPAAVRAGIALVLKLRAISALKKRGVKLFGTTNDEQNAAMRGINRKMGYTLEAPTSLYEKRFT